MNNIPILLNYPKISEAKLRYSTNLPNSLQSEYNNTLTTPYNKVVFHGQYAFDLQNKSKILNSGINPSGSSNTTIVSNNKPPNTLGSLYLAGTGYVSYTNSSIFAPSADFTIEGWFNYQSNENYPSLVSRRVSGSEFNYQIWYSKTSQYFLLTIGTSASTRTDYGFSMLESEISNKWTHFAVVRKGWDYYIFINGKKRGRWYNNSPLRTNSSEFKIGQSSTYSDSRWKGNIADIVFYNGVAKYINDFNINNYTNIYSQGIDTKSISHEFALYGKTKYNGPSFIVKKDPEILDRNNSTMYLPLFNNFNDYSTIGRSITNTNVELQQGAAYFNGTNSYITAPDSDDLTVSSNDFTIEMDIYLYSNSEAMLFEKQGGDSIDSGAHYFRLNTNGTLELFLNENSANTTNSITLTSTVAIPTNKWVKLGAHRIEDTVFITLNNEILAQGTYTYATWNDTYPLLIGAAKVSGTPAQYWLNGLIKNYKFYNGFCSFNKYKEKWIQ